VCGGGPGKGEEKPVLSEEDRAVAYFGGGAPWVRVRDPSGGELDGRKDGSVRLRNGILLTKTGKKKWGGKRYEQQKRATAKPAGRQGGGSGKGGGMIKREKNLRALPGQLPWHPGGSERPVKGKRQPQMWGNGAKTGRSSRLGDQKEYEGRVENGRRRGKVPGATEEMGAKARKPPNDVTGLTANENMAEGKADLGPPGMEAKKARSLRRGGRTEAGRGPRRRTFRGVHPVPGKSGRHGGKKTGGQVRRETSMALLRNETTTGKGPGRWGGVPANRQ